jgi:hypothetical protein
MCTTRPRQRRSRRKRERPVECDFARLEKKGMHQAGRERRNTPTVLLAMLLPQQNPPVSTYQTSKPLFTQLGCCSLQCPALLSVRPVLCCVFVLRSAAIVLGVCFCSSLCVCWAVGEKNSQITPAQRTM